MDRWSSSEQDNDELESLQSPSKTIQFISLFISIRILDDLKIPHGSVPLTPDQASILTNYLIESKEDEAQLHLVLANITNATTFRESLLERIFSFASESCFLGQINLANAGCILRLRELLVKTDNDLTKSRVLLALNNLALNDFAITQFSV